MKNFYRNIFLFILFPLWGLGGFGWDVYAQLYPVQVTPIFNSPYSVKLSDYATSIDTKLQLLINPTDIAITNRQVRLKFYLQGNGINAQSSDYIQGERPIFINGGELQTLTNVDIAALFRLENLQGISPAQYANPLPEGMYSFCFELYDFVTNQKISQKSCANLYLVLNDPPLLNTPQRNELIAATEFPNILFTWTPRQINATNVSYKFELKQLFDPTLDPQIAFQMAPVLHEETLFATALVYNLSMPILTPGMRYAWRVKAISTSGLSENAVFKNDGYSEIYSFKYTAPCLAPTFLLSETQSSKSAKITWQGVPEHTLYQLQYKKQNVANARWFSSNSLNTQSLLTNLEPGTTYEFRVGASCDLATEGIQSFTYSGSNTFTTPTTTNGVPAYSCGIVPQISIQNQNPITNLIQSETFTAGDFPVTILELEGHNPYSGRGYIVVPYLSDTKIAVEFKDIVVNTDYQLISGVVETSYDPEWGNVVDVSNILESAEILINQIKTGVEELIQNGTISKGEADTIIKEAEAEHEKIIKSGEEIKEVQEQIAKEKEETEEKQEPTEEQQKKIETAKASMNDAQNSLKDIADKYGAKAGKGSRESDSYFQGLLPLLVNNGTIQVKQIDGRGSFTFKTTDESNLKTYSTTISGKKYTVIITTSNSTKEELEKAKSMVDNPTDGIMIYNHYDLKNSKLGYKVNFGSNYYNNPKQYSQEAINALFVFGLNNKLDDAKNISDWGSEIFKITSQIDVVFQEVINKAENFWFTTEGLTKIKEVFTFLQKCKTDYAQQKEGYIPRCLWDHNNSIPYITDMAFSAGFTDGLIETVVGVFQIANFVSCWDFTNINFFNSDCAQTRDKTIQVLQLVYSTFSDYSQFSTATSGAWSNIKGYVDETTKLDNQARYNQGKIVFNVASLFIGVGEAKAILKGQTTLTAVLKESLLAYKNLPKSISKLVLNSSKNIKAVLQKTGAEFYLFYKLNTTELKFGTVVNGTFKADNWITTGNKLETIENCAYLGKDGKLVTGTIEVIEKDGVVGVRVGSDLPSVIRQLTTKPSYRPLRIIFSKQNKTISFIGKWDEIIDGKQNGLQKLISELSETDLNIYMQSGKFDNPGGFNMLSIEDWEKRVVQEALKKGIAKDTKAFDDFIWDTYNKPWLQNSMQRGDEIIIWSNPLLKENIEKYYKFEGVIDKSFYGREIDFIRNNASNYGYDFNEGINLGTFTKNRL